MRPQGFKNSFTGPLHPHTLAFTTTCLSLTAIAARTLSPSNSSVTATFQLPSRRAAAPSLFEMDRICSGVSSLESQSTFQQETDRDIPGWCATCLVRFRCWQKLARGMVYGAGFSCWNQICFFFYDRASRIYIVSTWFIHGYFDSWQGSGSSQLRSTSLSDTLPCLARFLQTASTVGIGKISSETTRFIYER